MRPANTTDNKLDDYHGAKFDNGKARYDLILPEFDEAIAQVLTFGAQKYAAHSWRTVPDCKERYYSAMMRHLAAHRRGERYDPETGMLHMAHAACNMYFLTQLELEEEYNNPDQEELILE